MSFSGDVLTFRRILLSLSSGLENKMRGKNDARYREGRKVIGTTNEPVTKIHLSDKQVCIVK